ncbi:hypothetical protein LXL04_018730 [Taraxacum kok-saghyz]
MAKSLAMLITLLHVVVKLTALTPQTIEIEPGTIMKIWVPKETVTTNDAGKTIYTPPTKPAVLLLHPFGNGSITIWSAQVNALTQDYSVYVPDFLFFGGSFTDRKERSVSFQAEFVAKGLKKLKVEKVTLVGLSYGGIVGFKMANLYPKLVKSMVVSSTVIDLTESINRHVLKKLNFTSLSELLMPTTVEGLKRFISVVAYRPQPAPDSTMFSNRKERNELLEALVVPDEDANWDFNYSQEIYMLWGADDKIFDLDLARVMKKRLGEKTTLDWIKDAGHVVETEQSSEYNKRLKCFLEHVTKYE